MLEQPLSSETNTKKINLMDLTRQQMREFFAELGEKPFRADQLVKWIYHFGEDNFDNMTNINKKLREKLKAVAEIKAPEVAVEEHSAEGFKASYIDEVMVAIVMPTTSNDVALLPEGERYSPSIKVFTQDPLNIGDLVHFRGFDYRVSASSDWGDYGYFNQIAIRHRPTAKVDSTGFEVT